MEIITHRINTLAQLEVVPSEYGVEVDLRDFGDRLILQHDPFMDGEDFETFLSHYRHGTLILNIKSERIEHRVLQVLRRYAIPRYFFLDSSFPMVHLLAASGERNIALRYSELEGLDTVLAMRGRVDWVWVDCFSRLPLNRDTFHRLKDAGFKICLVSPELQGRPDDLDAYRQVLDSQGIWGDAVCTKLAHVSRWQNGASRRACP